MKLFMSILLSLGLTASMLTLAGAQPQQRQQRPDRATQMADTVMQSAVEALAAETDPLQLIFRKDVQRDMGLELGQRNRIDNLRERQLGELRQARLANRRNNGPVVEMEEKHRKETEAKLDEWLTPAQRTRLNEIVLQQRGEAAVLSADIQKQLEATEEQKQRFQQILAGRDAKMAELQAGLQQRSVLPTEANTRVRQIQKEMNDTLREALTSEQQGKLKALGGKPFKPGS